MGRTGYRMRKCSADANEASKRKPTEQTRRNAAFAAIPPDKTGAASHGCWDAEETLVYLLHGSRFQETRLPNPHQPVSLNCAAAGDRQRGSCIGDTSRATCHSPLKDLTARFLPTI